MLEFLLPLLHCFQLAFPLRVFTITWGVVVTCRSANTVVPIWEGTVSVQTSDCPCNNVVFAALKALPRMVANRSSVLCVDWSSNARATGRDTWSSTQAWKATSVLCVPSVVLAKTILSPTWRWKDMDFLHLVTLHPFHPHPHHIQLVAIVALGL